MAVYEQRADFPIVPDAAGNYPAQVGPRTLGWFAGGVWIDNLSPFWWLIKETGQVVPPYTTGWTRDIRPGIATFTLIKQSAGTIFYAGANTLNVTLYSLVDGTPSTVGDNNGVSSPTTVQGTVVISGPVSISGTVTVTGTVSISGAVTVNGAVTVSGSVSISSGTVSISGTVTVAGAVTISSGTVVVSSITAGNVTVQSNVTDLTIIPGVFSLNGNGVTKVAVTGTAIVLHSSLAVKVVMIKARNANNGTVYLGISTVTNNETAGTGGLQLDPGDMVAFTNTNLNTIFINGTAGDGVSYAWWV